MDCREEMFGEHCVGISGLEDITDEVEAGLDEDQEASDEPFGGFFCREAGIYRTEDLFDGGVIIADPGEGVSDRSKVLLDGDSGTSDGHQDMACAGEGENG